MPTMKNVPETADIVCAVHEGSGRVFAVAAFAGADVGESAFYKVTGDWQTVEAATAHVLYDVLGLSSNAQTTITVHPPLVYPDDETAEAFHAKVGEIFDRTSFPKGVGSA